MPQSLVTRRYTVYDTVWAYLRRSLIWFLRNTNADSEHKNGGEGVGVWWKFSWATGFFLLPSSNNDFLVLSAVPEKKWNVCEIHVILTHRHDKCKVTIGYPENTRHWSNAGLMLGRRRRRWANMNPTLVQCLAFAGLCLRPTCGPRKTVSRNVKFLLRRYYIKQILRYTIQRQSSREDRDLL